MIRAALTTGPREKPLRRRPAMQKTLMEKKILLGVYKGELIPGATKPAIPRTSLKSGRRTSREKKAQ